MGLKGSSHIARIATPLQRIERKCYPKAQIGKLLLTKSAACAEKWTGDDWESSRRHAIITVRCKYASKTRSGQEPESNHSPKQVKPYKWTQPDKNKRNGIQLNHILWNRTKSNRINSMQSIQTNIQSNHIESLNSINWNMKHTPTSNGIKLSNQTEWTWTNQNQIESTRTTSNRIKYNPITGNRINHHQPN